MLRLDRGDDRLDDRGDPTGEFETLAGRLALGVAVGVEGADCPSSPKIPGSRWPNGRMALNRCVTIEAPAAMADCACSNVASEWPTEKTIPRETNSGMREIISPLSRA